MMQQVTAFQDDSGNLHKTKRDAIVADFIHMMQSTWGKMPDQRDRGDPVVIARILASPTYAAREALLEALNTLDRQLKAID